MNDKRKIKGKKVVATFLCILAVLGFTDSVSATELQGDVADTESTSEKTDTVFNLKIIPVEEFEDDIQFLFVSEDGEYEYEITLSEDNAYTASFTAEGNTTYRLMYYYESYKTYEIEELKEEYVCENGTLWNLNYNVINRINPVESTLVPLWGDMSEEAESLRKEEFESSVFPNMTQEDVVEWYYENVKDVIESNAREDAFSSITNGIRNETSEAYFKSNSGTSEEWKALSDEKLIAFYYGCVLPSIVLDNNDFDYDDYIENIGILNKLCQNIGCEKLYDVTYTLWEYIWEYQRSEKQMPNFPTLFITEYRAEDNALALNQNTEDGGVVSHIESDEAGSTENTNIVFRYLKEHWFSIVCLMIGGGVLIAFYYKEKKDKKGKVKR